MTEKSKTFLSGNKDVDREILSKLSDKDLLFACKTNTYAYDNICDKTFFRNLVYNRYSETIKYKDLVKVNKQKDWKNFYLSVVYYVGKLKEDFSYEYKADGSPELEYLSRKFYIEIFLRKHVDLKNPYAKYDENRAFLFSIIENNRKILQYLIEKGVDIHKDNNYALRIAVNDDNLAIVKILVENKADIHSDNDYAVRTAAFLGNIELVKYLVSKGAKYQSLNNMALAAARDEGHIEVVEYLESLP